MVKECKEFMRALFFSLMMVSQNPVLFDFSKESSLSNWFIINDGVMGGVSKGQLILTPEGHGKFTGTVSLANNGGFTSIRCNLPPTAIASNMKISIRLKGDGKNYQFRVRHQPMAYQSYIHDFSTTGEWQTIEIPFNAMYASFRGYRLDIPNFKGDQMEEIAFLIGNKKAESFKLIIDSISLE